MKRRSCLPNDPKLSSVYVLAHSGINFASSILNFALSIQYVLFCSTFVLRYDEVRYQLDFFYNPMIFKRNYTFNF